MQEAETTVTGGSETLYLQVSCPYCGASHAGVCPLVLEMEYYENGAVRRVKFIEPAERQQFKVVRDDA